MKRELKFRLWDGEEMQMPSQVGLYVFEEEGITDVVDGIGKGHCQTFNVMQYTGLKDKNGVEIYEGDIIRVEAMVNITEDDVFDAHEISQELIAKVVFGHACFDLETIEKDLHLYQWGFYGEDDLDSSLEVVGNIHKNPELLT